MICGICTREIKNYDLQQVTLHLEGRCSPGCRHGKIIIYAHERDKLPDDQGACGCCGNIVYFDSVVLATIKQLVQHMGLAPTLCKGCSDD